MMRTVGAGKRKCKFSGVEYVYGQKVKRLPCKIPLQPRKSDGAFKKSALRNCLLLSVSLMQTGVSPRIVASPPSMAVLSILMTSLVWSLAGGSKEAATLGFSETLSTAT